MIGSSRLQASVLPSAHLDTKRSVTYSRANRIKGLHYVAAPAAERRETSGLDGTTADGEDEGKATPLAAAAEEYASQCDTAAIGESRRDRTRDGEDAHVTDQLKMTMRAMTHPVVVITSRPITSSPKDDDATAIEGCRGLTVSSFNTVSLSPQPMVSFNIRTPSRTWDAMESSGRACIHVLSATSDAAFIAQIFTTPRDPPHQGFLDVAQVGGRTEVGTRVPVASHGGVSQDLTPISWAPVIEAKGAVKKWIHVVLDRKHCQRVGDHALVVARVQSVKDCGAEGASNGTVAGLAYTDGKYRSLGGSLTPWSPSVVSGVESSERNSGGGTSTKCVTNSTGEDQAEHGDSSGPSRATCAPTTPPHHIRGEQGSCQTRDQAPTHGRDSDHTSQPARPPGSHRSSVGPRTRSELFSTLSTPRLEHLRSSRTYSSTGRQSTDAEGPVSLHDYVTHPTLLQHTVGEFLDFTREIPSSRRARIRALCKARRVSQRAKRQLRRHRRRGTLTPASEQELQDTIERCDSGITRVLARRSARDLRRMLDQGRVDARLAPFMERTVERGQVFLLQQMRRAEGLAAQGEVALPRAEETLRKLRVEYEMMSTELMRLRQMVSEDEEGEEGQEGLPGGEEAGDGRGNV